MAKQKTHVVPGIGNQLFEALTQPEIAQLLEVLFEALSPDLRAAALDHLPPDTKQTIMAILSPSEADAHMKTQPAAVSSAKLAETWSNLWRTWDKIVLEASDEDGDYIVQEAHWEPPYFDEYTFIKNLEQVAKQMRPLLEDAFHNGASHDTNFAEALASMEDEVASGLPEWMEMFDGIGLEEHLTYCLLHWEWLESNAEGLDAFSFALRVRDWEETFAYIYLDENTLLDYFTALSETDQQHIFEGMTRHQADPEWKTVLANTYNHWHGLHLYYVEQFAPEQLMDNLRATIPQQWENGLPVIEDLLDKEDYQKSLSVIKDTLASLLKSNWLDTDWAPEESFMFASVSLYDDDGRRQNYASLLDYYQKTAVGLGQTELANLLVLQQTAIKHFFDWEKMYQAFVKAAIPEDARQSLLNAWRAILLNIVSHIPCIRIMISQSAVRFGGCTG